MSRQDDAPEDDHAHRIELACAVLMLEISLADSTLDDSEKSSIENALGQRFKLPAEEIETLLDLAHREVDHAVSLHDFTRLLNERMSEREKEQVVEYLWQVAFADGVLDKYEEYYIRKIADLLYVPHVRLMKSRHRASRSAG